MSLLKKNEKEANLIVAKVMRISFIIFTLIFILNVVGIFEVKPAVNSFAAARSSASGVEVAASAEGNLIQADFSCGNGRTLHVALVVDDGATYQIREWKMSAVQNEEPAPGQLLIVD